MCSTKHLFPLCHPKAGELHPLPSTPRHPRAVLGASPSVQGFGKSSLKGCGVAECVFSGQDISKGAFEQPETELRAPGGRSITGHQTAPKPKQPLELGWSIFLVLGEDDSGRGWALVSLGFGAIPAGFSHCPGEVEPFQGQNRCRWLFHCWFSIPSLPRTQDFIYIPRQLEQSFDKLHPWQIPSTDLATHRLCSQWNDLGIEGLSNVDPQPNTSRSIKHLMIPDSWNQSLGAEIIFNIFFPPWDKTKLFCSNPAVNKSLIKAIGWFTSGITEVRTIKHGLILQLTCILCYPLSRLSAASAWGEERWGTARSYMRSTRNYWCQGNTAGETKVVHFQQLGGVFILWLVLFERIMTKWTGLWVV